MRSYLTIPNLKDLVWCYKPDIIFLMETKNSADVCEHIRRRVGMDHAIYVKVNDTSGGIVLSWNKKSLMSVHLKSENIIDFSMGATWG